jgi:hypothetical protein
MANMSAIASMLAQSGQNIGQQIGAPVQAFGQGVGQQLGGMLTRRRQSQELEEARRIISQYSTAGNINPGMLTKKAQEAEAEGKDYLADVFRKGAEQANTNLAAGQNLTAYNQLAHRLVFLQKKLYWCTWVRFLVSTKIHLPPLRVQWILSKWLNLRPTKSTLLSSLRQKV